MSAKARCHRGEQRLSWNTSGPPGPAGTKGPSGAAGAQGAAGAPGAAIAFSASSGAPVEVSLEKETILLSKTLPPGSYFASFKDEFGGESGAPGRVKAICALIYQPGTAAVLEAKAETLDLSVQNFPLAADEGNFLAVTTLTMQGTFTTSVTVTLSAACSGLAGTVTPKAVYAQLQAIGVSSIQ